MTAKEALKLIKEKGIKKGDKIKITTTEKEHKGKFDEVYSNSDYPVDPLWFLPDYAYDDKDDACISCREIVNIEKLEQ